MEKSETSGIKDSGRTGEYTVDIAVIGAGAAGLSAAIYGARAKRSTLIIEKKRPGGQAATTERLENYPGFPGGVGGRELMQLMKEQSEQMGAEILRAEIVSIKEYNGIYEINGQKGERIEARSIVLSPGCQPRQLGIPGEQEFLGKGVSYCATCDAELYEEATVIVVGSGDAAIEEANYLSRYAEKVLMVVVHDKGILDCNKSMADEAFKNPKLVWLWNHSLTSIQGDEIVNGVTVKNLKKGTEEHIDCDGVFMFVGIIPETSFLKGFVDLEKGYIAANDRMETNRTLVYAAGDARVKTLRQVVTAASDGAIAAFYADKALSELDGYSRAMEGTDGECLLYFYTPPVQRSLDLFPDVEKKAESLKLPLRKFDIYRYKNIAERFGVVEIPKLIHIKNGKKINEIKL